MCVHTVEQMTKYLSICCCANTTILRRYGELPISQSKRPVIRLFINIVRSVLGTIEIPTFDDLSAPISPAILAQQDIGLYHMIVGFVATEWTTVLEKLGAEHPQT